MLKHGVAYLDEKFDSLNVPLNGHIDLTYRCDYRCLHCFCTGSEDFSHELSASEIKKIIDEIACQGCLFLALSGGDPLTRPDFLEIYTYAKEKGFLVTILTNAYRLNRRLTNYLAKHPPLSIDVTVNSMDEDNYSYITQMPIGALCRVKENIHYAAKQGISMIIKAIAMKPNIGQIPKIKAWAQKLPCKSREKLFNFRYDPVVYPRFNGDQFPCTLRLDESELDALYGSDTNIRHDHDHYLSKKFPDASNRNSKLYFCNTYKNQFFIDPFGRLKFCSNTNQFSSDLRKTSFAQGFYRKFAAIEKVKFKTNSPCRKCVLRKMCISCPAAALLETGSVEKPVDYFCQMAKRAAEQTPINCKR